MWKDKEGKSSLNIKVDEKQFKPSGQTNNKPEEDIDIPY